MTAGIAIKDQKPGELIYLNLPNRPGSGDGQGCAAIAGPRPGTS